MNSPSLFVVWVQLLALLAVEVGLIALSVALLWRRSSSAAWRRTFCRIGIMAALGATTCELSGSARALAGWPARLFARRESGRAWTEANGIVRVDRVAVGHAAAGKATASLPAVGSMKTRRPGGEQASVVPWSTAEIDPVRRAGSAGAANQTTVSPKPTGVSEQELQPASPTEPTVGVARRSEAALDLLCFLWLGLAWGMGALLAAVRVGLAHCLFLLYRLRRRPITDRAVLQRVEDLAGAVGIPGRVRVIESARLASPIAYGLLRPTVGLPPEFGERFNGARQDAMLVHELAHLAAHDPLWCLLADAATIPLWWHPGIWWLRRRLHLASEMAADEASLLVADGPQVLAECLVELGSRLTQPAPLGHLRVSGFRSHLGRRVQQLVHLEGRSWSPPHGLRAGMVTIFGPMVLVAVVVLCTAWAAPQPVTKGDSMNTMRLNWKRSLAAFALLSAATGPDATSALAQSESVASPPLVAEPGPPADSSTAPPATPAAPGPVEKPARPAPEQPDAAAAAAAEMFRRRYGLSSPIPVTPVTAVQPAKPVPEEPGKRGARLEARLKKILLPQIAFDGLPLGEVLRVLSDESIKRDPEKTGVNFLINPNFPPVALTGEVDPNTGLPLAASGEAFDMSSVVIKFNLPLRNVSMKDVLDAIITVADHPIEYKLEDYAVVFSAKPQTVAGQPVSVAPFSPPPAPQYPPGVSPVTGLPVMPPPTAFAPPTEPLAHQPMTAEALAAIEPQSFNIDFGSGSPSKQVGPAAAGRAGDFWNTVSVGFNDHFTESDLKFAGGDPSPIEVEMINLGGGWSFRGKMGVKSPMLDTYNYPTGNRGGNSQVVLHRVPPGKYSLYLYGHGPDAPYYGDYTVTVGSRNYGRKQTTHGEDAGRSTKWVEGSQYVRFSGVKVGVGESIRILIQPGGQVSDPSGRTFSDAMICGLQLIPAK